MYGMQKYLDCNILILFIVWEYFENNEVQVLCCFLVLMRLEIVFYYYYDDIVFNKIEVYE